MTQEGYKGQNRDVGLKGPISIRENVSDNMKASLISPYQCYFTVTFLLVWKIAKFSHILFFNSQQTTNNVHCDTAYSSCLRWNAFSVDADVVNHVKAEVIYWLVGWQFDPWPLHSARVPLVKKLNPKLLFEAFIGGWMLDHLSVEQVNGACGTKCTSRRIKGLVNSPFTLKAHLLHINVAGVVLISRVQTVSRKYFLLLTVSITYFHLTLEYTSCS